ncbi:conserved Plasmodium protein, unknown function [Plasmodium ovale]|nr:conserved Plasmodium protein, unknown function [Plasmodium ovale]
MFSLFKAVFSNAQDGKDFKILIIGESGSGKTSLFNLICSYHNKSKYDILNTEVAKGDRNSNCALGFNTKKINFDKKNLKIYDLEGTSTNTIDIYDCYYEDTDVIFYVIDAKCEKHIFKVIFYLSCLGISTNNDNKEKKIKKHLFLKPIIILGNKSEDSSSFFSAPCISNYVKSIDVYTNGKFWQFALSSDNVHLGYYLGALYERVVHYFIERNLSLEEFLEYEKATHDKKGDALNEKGDMHNEKRTINDEKTQCPKKGYMEAPPKDEVVRKCNALINDIRNNKKRFISVEEVEGNELLSNMMKNIINEKINDYKRIPINVYNISVLKNKGIYEVIEIAFVKYFNKNMNTKEEDTQDSNEVKPMVENSFSASGNNSHSKKEQRDIFFADACAKNVMEMRNSMFAGEFCRGDTDVVHYSNEYKSGSTKYGKRCDYESSSVYPFFPTTNPKSDYTCKQNYSLHNNRMYNHKREKSKNTQNNAYAMYECNDDTVNLFIEHIQHLHFGKNTCEKLQNKFPFLHKHSSRRKENFKIFKGKQKSKSELDGNLQKEEAERGSHLEEVLQQNRRKGDQSTEEVKQEHVGEETLAQKGTYEQREIYWERETYAERDTIDGINTPVGKTSDSNDKQKGKLINEFFNSAEMNTNHGECPNVEGKIRTNENEATHEEFNRGDDTYAEQKKEGTNDREDGCKKGKEQKADNAIKELHERESVHESNSEDVKEEENIEEREKKQIISKETLIFSEAIGDEYCTDNNSQTDYSSNEEKGKRKVYDFHGSSSNSNNVEDTVDHVYKGKVSKKRYSIIEKKKKKKDLCNKETNDLGENSSNSFEDVNLMNIMCFDSLNEI